MREGFNLSIDFESVGCVSYLIVQGHSVEIGKRKRRVKCFEEKLRKSVWSGYGAPKVELGEVNVLC